MTNPYVAEVLATERIHQLHLDAERYRRARAARVSRPPRLLNTAWLRQGWSFALSAPRHFRTFVLAGQLGPARCADCV